MIFSRIKIEVTKDLFNVIMSEIKQYIEIIDGEDRTETEILLNHISHYSKYRTDTDGTEFAVIRLYPYEASDLIFISSLMSSVNFGADDYYSEFIGSGKI